MNEIENMALEISESMLVDLMEVLGKSENDFSSENLKTLKTWLVNTAILSQLDHGPAVSPTEVNGIDGLYSYFNRLVRENAVETSDLEFYNEVLKDLKNSL